MQKMEVACVQTRSYLIKDLTVLVCCHCHCVLSLGCSTHRRVGDTPRSYETLHLVCRYLLPFPKRQPKLQSHSEHESVQPRGLARCELKSSSSLKEKNKKKPRCPRLRCNL